MAKFNIETHFRDEMINITSMVEHCLPCLDDDNCGVAYVFCRHTTAALTVNENADSDVRHDMIAKLDELIKHNETYYQHDEGNSAAHLKSSLLGFTLTLPVRHGALALGMWQGVYLCEFDGARTRTVEVFYQKVLD